MSDVEEAPEGEEAAAEGGAPSEPALQPDPLYAEPVLPGSEEAEAQAAEAAEAEAETGGEG